jgi:hypothetical protein
MCLRLLHRPPAHTMAQRAAMRGCTVAQRCNSGATWRGQVSSHRPDTPPLLLNYITTPNVLLSTAVTTRAARPKTTFRLQTTQCRS